MSTRKEEERNEKIIRGLMKLPPNRRCINCNNIGPQYVCTTFWTFICITCSGIHREFTHRVKSVSMAKFTSEEVEALQKGGNQRAREIFLKNWDLQRQRLPDSSNVVKVREFIKNVYVDKKYAGGKALDKTPEDIQQNLRHHDEEARRASSYHSYSQSPPYDYQYEERRYGKQASAFTRKHGSGRSMHEGRFSSFSSPSRFSDRIQEEKRSAHGESNPRAPDFSMSSPGDYFRSDIHSPNSEGDAGFRSPQYQASRDVNENIQSQRTGSSSDSFRSFDSNSTSFKSASFVDPASEPEQSARGHLGKLYTVSSLPQPSVSGSFGGLDLFDASFMQQTVTSGEPIDLFQSPEVPTPPVNSVQTSSAAAFPTHDSSQAHSSSLHSPMPQLPAATLDGKRLYDEIPKNEGWATFDSPNVAAPNLCVEPSIAAALPPTNDSSLERFNQTFFPSTGHHWQTFVDDNGHQTTSLPSKPQEGSHNIHVSDNAINSLSWNAFEEPTRAPPIESIQQTVKVQSPIFNQFSGDFSTDDIRHTSLDMGSYDIPLHADRSGSLYTATSIPSVVGVQSHLADGKPTNPFDLPYDTDFDSSNMFLDMSSLQNSLPNGQPSNAFLDGATQTWFHQEMPYIPAAQQGALGFMGAQVPNAHVTNATAQGHVASVGGNPFA